jgi:putative nucleotidyltransferase with HDIG domain
MVHQTIAAEGISVEKLFSNTDMVISVFLLCVFVLAVIPILTFRLKLPPQPAFGIFDITSYPNILQVSAIVILVSLSVGIYINRYQFRLIQNHTRAVVLVIFFLLMLLIARIGTVTPERVWWITGTAIVIAIILAISYDQRFAVGLCLFYCILASFITNTSAETNQPVIPDINQFLIMTSGCITCCFGLKDIRTRTKLLEIGALAAVIVFIMSFATLSLQYANTINVIFWQSFYQAIAVLLVGFLIQGLLPIIEKNFDVVTAMTLLVYSDASQPLLRKLAMEAPGTFSHSLLVGSIAEAAAEAIGRNGLLCRVGGYYHDIGKLNKPEYFIENEIGPINRHKELSPAMSQLIIVGHVKDGSELAKEYGLPPVIRQFI